MSHAEVATKIGQELASKLQGITDEKVIKALSIEAWKVLSEAITNPETFRTRGLSNVRKAIKTSFPDSETQRPGYYHTTQGKGQISRYEHIALWYLTSNTDRWEITGDKTRQTYIEGLPSLTKPETEAQSEPQVEQQVEKQSEQQKLTMTLETLNLTDDTKTLVTNVLQRSGIGLEKFIQDACASYAKDLMNKIEAKDSVETLSTSELLNNSKYRTMPGRAEELAKRGIQAMMHHNDMATEKSQKWHISQTSVSSLTGSKASLVKPVIEQFKLTIDDHNTKHGLNPYDNRGRSTKIEENIDFVNFDSQLLPVEQIVSKPIEQTEKITEPVKLTEESTPIETKKELIKPVSNVARKTFTMKAESATSLDIYDYLKQNPESRVLVRDGRKGIYYILAKNELGESIGYMNEETGDIEKINC